jgi:hypothetical protein
MAAYVPQDNAGVDPEFQEFVAEFKGKKGRENMKMPAAPASKGGKRRKYTRKYKNNNYKKRSNSIKRKRKSFKRKRKSFKRKRKSFKRKSRKYKR